MSGHKLVQEPDKIATNTVIGVGVGSLALFAVGIIATYGFLRSLGPAIETVEGSRQVGQAEMGLINQLPFKTDNRYYEQRDREMKQLGSYGWVDRKAGTVHIPIEHAMELVTEGVRPAPGPKDATPRARESDEAKKIWPVLLDTQPVTPPTEPPLQESPKPIQGVPQGAVGDQPPKQEAAPAKAEEKPAENKADGEKKAEPKPEGDKKPEQK
jgi:hypothetical protein